MNEYNLYQTIVVTGNPKGNFLPFVIEGTPKPGTIMQIKTATAKVNGRYTAIAYAPGGSGQRPVGPIMVLMHDELQGRTIHDAYATGSWGMCYCPIPGDELLCLVKNIAGTETFAIGDLLMPEQTTGLLIDTSSPEIEPFVLLEADTSVWSADTLMHVMYTGN